MSTKIRNIARATRKKPIIKASDKKHVIKEQRSRLASVSEHVHFRDHFSLLETIVSNVLLSVIFWTPTFQALTRTFSSYSLRYILYRRTFLRFEIFLIVLVKKQEEKRERNRKDDVYYRLTVNIYPLIVGYSVYLNLS